MLLHVRSTGHTDRAFGGLRRTPKSAIVSGRVTLSIRLTASLACCIALAACSGEPPGSTGSDAGTASADLPPPAPADASPPKVPCGRLTELCAPGDACEGADDCISRVCKEGTCRAATSADETKNGDETDIDCGGLAAPACADGKACGASDDCASGVCAEKICLAPTATDGVRNGDETGVDCGGSTTNAPRCAPGAGCSVDADCDNVRCDAVQKKCLPASHDDGLVNLDETGIDCGGPGVGVARCPTGQGCATTSDCDNVLCDDATKKCDAPSAIDGLKNGTETDIDCGGGAPTNAPKCKIGSGCKVAGDCTSGGCSAALGGTCSPPSCGTNEKPGITTCGTGETGQPGAQHESCCKSLVLPTRTTRRLDKYEITAGRFRTFLTSVGPNVRAWVQSYVAANPGSQLAKLANVAIVDGSTNAPSTMTTLFPAEDRFAPHSLTAHMAIDIDNYGGIRGCANYDGSYSANTYWMDDLHYGDFGLPSRSLPRAASDEKPLNCAMPMMFVAFCAWDGGELATLADYHDVWVNPPNTYPWGSTVKTRPDFNWCNGTYQNGGFKCQCDGVNNTNLTADQACPAGGFNGLSGAGVFYEWPRNTDRSKDNSPLIAQPGRFTGDATLLKSGTDSWMDVYANLAEYTGDIQTDANLEFCDFSVTPGVGATVCSRLKYGASGTRYTGIPRVGIIGQTWEGHRYGRGKLDGFQATFQYGKFGGRCVRPATPF